MNDRISLVFHVLGCLVLLRSIVLLSRQQSVRGVSLWQAAFFASWSCWNLFFYDALGLFWSWYGAVVMAMINCTWVLMLCYFKVREVYTEWCKELQAAFDDEEPEVFYNCVAYDNTKLTGEIVPCQVNNQIPPSN